MQAPAKACLIIHHVFGGEAWPGTLSRRAKYCCPKSAIMCAMSYACIVWPVCHAVFLRGDSKSNVRMPKYNVLRRSDGTSRMALADK